MKSSVPFDDEDVRWRLIFDGASGWNDNGVEKWDKRERESFS